jgi:hypothetical protein
MPRVKLKIKAEPVDVEQDELDSLRQQGLLEEVLEEEAAGDGRPAVPPKPGDPRPAVPPAAPARPADVPARPADAAPAGETKEQ